MIGWLSRERIGCAKLHTLASWTLAPAVLFVAMAGQGCALPGGQLQEEASTLGLKGQYDQAIPLVQRALAIREEAIGPDHKQPRSYTLD